MTAPRVEPSDFEKCPKCGVDCLRVGYWNGYRPQVKLVDAAFEYAFTSRDYRGDLVVHEAWKVNQAAHSWKCKAEAPAAQPEAPAEDDGRDTNWRKKGN